MSNKKHRKDIDKAVRNLINFAEQQTQWQHRLDEMFEQMLALPAQHLNIDGKDLAEQIRAQGYWHMVFGYVFEQFATVLWDNEKLNCIDEYLKRRGWREALHGRRYLQAISDSDVGLWEATSVKAGSHVDVRLYGSSEKPIRILEKVATKSINQWSCLAARVIKMNNKYLFTGSILPLPPEQAATVQRVLDRAKKETASTYQQLVKDGLLESLPSNAGELDAEGTRLELPNVMFSVWVTYLYESLNRPVPSFQNRDGDTIQITKVRFPLIASVKEISQKLDSLPELDRNNDELVWSWLPAPADELINNEQASILGQLFLQNDSLQLDVNSNERAKKGSQWISKELGKLVGKPLTVHENPLNQLDNTRPADPNTNFNKTAEGQALIKDYMDKHYTKTLDQAVPALGNKTPRECAAKPTLHKEVVQWLKTLENHSPQHSQAHNYDFSWIWQELNLGKYKP